MAVHEQTWVKVNAPVDRGIAELVTALSGFSKLQTIESCQGDNGWAWVCFACGDSGRSWRELAEFVLGFLGPRVVGELGDRVNVSVHVTEAGLYRAEMAVRTEAISATVALLNDLQRDRLTA